MATHLFEHRAQRPRSRAAWMASVGVHACLLAALGYVSWTTLGRGSRRPGAEEPAVILGLSGGSVEEEASAEADADVAADAVNALDEAAASEGEPGSELAVDGVVPSGMSLEESASPLAPPPRLPLLALTGVSRTPAAPAPGAPSAPGPAGSLRLDQLVERATVTVFGAVGEGSRFVYLFDHSTSMAGAPLAAAKRQLIGSLDSLASVHQFQVIFFNHEVHAWDLTGGQQRIPFASDANKQLAEQFVRSVVATGGTERLAPLRRALAMNADVVFFLTDADDAMPQYDLDDTIDRAQGRGTAIACIEFGAGPAPEGENFLTRLAAATGGDYVYVDTTRLGR